MQMPSKQLMLLKTITPLCGRSSLMESNTHVRFLKIYLHINLKDKVTYIEIHRKIDIHREIEGG